MTGRPEMAAIAAKAARDKGVPSPVVITRGKRAGDNRGRAAYTSPVLFP